MYPTQVNPDTWPKVRQNQRTIVGKGAHTGEIPRVTKSYACIKLHEPVPSEIQATLSAWNKELRTTEAERGRKFCDGAAGKIIFMNVADIEDDDLVLEAGMQVFFKLYLDRRSFGNPGFGDCKIPKK